MRSGNAVLINFGGKVFEVIEEVGIRKHKRHVAIGIREAVDITNDGEDAMFNGDGGNFVKRVIDAAGDGMTVSEGIFGFKEGGVEFGEGADIESEGGIVLTSIDEGHDVGFGKENTLDEADGGFNLVDRRRHV